jgi:hypothetical protein
MRQMRTTHTKHVRQVATRLALAAGVVGSTLAPAAAQAQMQRTTVLVNTNPSSLYVYQGLHYGGAVWEGTSAGIRSAFAGIGTSETLLDLGQMMNYDALWVDQRYQSAPSKQELSNLLTFAATGRRVVIMGENATWGPWNNAVLTALGGREGTGQSQEWYWSNGHVAVGCLDGPAFSAVNSPLTDGVTSVNMSCGGYAVGGVPLFDYNVATLWGAQRNILTVLDGNVFDDRFIMASGSKFRQNVLDWLSAPLPFQATAAVAATVAVDAASSTLPATLPATTMLRFNARALDVRALDAVEVTATPEPASVALVGAGLLALSGAAARRRRR